MRRLIGISLFIGGLFAFGCGGSETGDEQGSTSTGSSMGMGGSGGGSASTGTGVGGGGGSTGEPQAPIMKSVAPLSGALHVEWENVTPDCTAIELDRKKDAGTYALAYTLTGAATSQHDDQVTAPGMYCYKARCKKGDLVSPDSNEKCGSP